MSESIDQKYARISKILSGGSQPGPDMVGILKIAVGDENLDFLTAFEESASLTMDQLKEILKNKGVELTEDEILQKVKVLGDNGVMMDQPTSSGIMIYRVVPYYRAFEWQFMRNHDNPSDDIKALAKYMDNLHHAQEASVQKNYDSIKTSGLQNVIPIDRTVLSSETNKESGDEIEIIIDESIEVPQEVVLPTQTVEEIINKYDEIAVGSCFCRNHALVLGNPCKQTHIRDSCFTMGKSANHTVKHGFARMISKEEALDLLAKIRDDGLVHKAYHYQSNPMKREDAICNCCSDCCPNSLGFMHGPTGNYTNYVAEINEDLCSGCGTCVEKCHNLIIELNENGIAERDEKKCIGCGVCAYFCPENAISMRKTELRKVLLMPPRK